MSQTAKKGDLALVVGNLAEDLNGRIVRVLSDPFMSQAWTRRREKLMPAELLNEIDVKSELGSVKWPFRVVPTRCLIPIRDPDADVSTKTEREVAA